MKSFENIDKKNQIIQKEKPDETNYDVVLVKKYYDYTSKYGIGYLLNNGFYGVYFNDHSKIIFNPETNIFFI